MNSAYTARATPAGEERQGAKRRADNDARTRNYDVQCHNHLLLCDLLARRSLGPEDLSVVKSDGFLWTSDSSGTKSGFEICAVKSISKLSARVIGFILLPFYVFGPILYLFVIGKRVKDSLIVDVPEGSNKEGRAKAYRRALDKVQEMAKRDAVTDVKRDDAREQQVLLTDTNGYKAAVVATLLGSFEEKYWWWKLFLMVEKAVLAILVLSGASSWIAVGVSTAGCIASVAAAPYWSDEEDHLDMLVRFTISLTCLAAGLLEAAVITGKEVRRRLAKRCEYHGT